ncbi:MAG: amidohydrolase family protein [Deltaproteobacteria bacterium]|nr:amidohydrolase family protein [Deltaproteobacteria bacterium]
MYLVDADGHVEESETTFSDKYFDPAFRAQRPRVVAIDKMVYWMIEEQMYPRRVGRGAHNLGTPASYHGKKTPHAQKKSDTIGSMEIHGVKERVEAMDKEGISLQVLYPTLFLAYPLAANPALVTAMSTAYNRFLGDQIGAHDRLKWAAVVNLDDVEGAVAQVKEAHELGAVAVMVLGTIGDRLLDDSAFLPFYEALVERDLTLAIHVGWSCPALSGLFTHIYPSSVNAFLMPVLLGFSSMINSGLLDRFPTMRVGFLEAGCQWVHFMIDRLDHRFGHSGNFLADILPDTVPKAKLAPMDYVRQGNLYLSAEVEDSLLPQVVELVGEGQVVYGSDMPHGDREVLSSDYLKQRRDLSESAKTKILRDNGARLYNLEITDAARKAS